MRIPVSSMLLTSFNVMASSLTCKIVGRMERRLAFAAFLIATVMSYTPVWGSPALDLQEEVVVLPVTCKTLLGDTFTVSMNITAFRPKGNGPFPLVVINHGAGGGDGIVRFEGVSRYFVRKGFVALVPSRVGNGIMNLDQGSAQVLAAIAYGRSLREVDAKRIVLVGWSRGGFITVGVAANNPPGVIAAINFAGFFGPINELWKHAEMGKHANVPMLWIYVENDRIFHSSYGEIWAKAFTNAGGQVDYRLLPAFGDDGHYLFTDGHDIWMPLAEEFLKSLGFTEPGLIERPQPTRFATIEDVDKVPYLGTAGQEDYRKFLQGALPRAFAVSSDGHWGYAQGDDALAHALANCQYSNGAAPCRLYAVDSDVVW